ncbi:hypothetical protein [Treponema socranskii]|uniref:hypothetical protein n=1 Tax=Treponema socranskii TaxID=53419 RepID=UPI003D6E4B73
MLINKSLLLILFCFFIATIGFLLVFMPSKRRKTNKIPAFVYSVIFCIIGLYLLVNQKSGTVAWKKINDTTYSAKIHTFQSATVFLLEENTYRLFVSCEDEFIKQYIKTERKCEKKKVSDREAAICVNIINDFEHTVNPEIRKAYYVLYMDYGTTEVVYLLNKISEKIEAERFCFRVF